jgi:hypoxanthine phosphoribosyltransferase
MPQGEKIVICGILKGAFVFITDLCRQLKRPYSCYFVEASSYNGQEQSDQVELLSRIVPSKFTGRKIVLVDELLDNGHTMHTMLNYLMRELKVPREDIATCCLFSKQQDDRPKHFDADITGLPNLPNLWLVGYGLDDDGTKRGWTELFAKPKIPGVPKVDEDAIFEDSAAGRSKLAEVRARMLKTVHG